MNPIFSFLEYFLLDFYFCHSSQKVKQGWLKIERNRNAYIFDADVVVKTSRGARNLRRKIDLRPEPNHDSNGPNNRF